MPAPDITENFIRIRVKEPSLFIDTSFKTIVIDSSKGIKAVAGKLKSEPNGGMVVQSYLFDKEKWEKEDAIKWVEEHSKMTDAILGSNEIIDFSDNLKESRPMEKLKKSFVFENKDFDDTEMSFVATASTEDKDRDGDIIVARGWKLKNYKKNPVVLWQHDSNLMPIARAEEVWVDDGKLKFKPIFASEDINPFAKQVYRAFKKKFLTSFSVRFDPIDWEDIQEDAKDDTNLIRRGRKFKSAELLEISAVNIPANPMATKSPELIDFVVKSYMYQNNAGLDFELEEIYGEAGDQLKIKIDKFMELKELKEQKNKVKSMDDIGSWVDSEIAKLEFELETDKKKMKLEQELKEIQAGITRLVKK